MTGARFARTGRCRFFAGFCALLVMIGMVAIFHSSQQELDEIRRSHIQCEQNMEAIRKRWQFTIEQKFQVEKAKEQELGELLTQKRNSEQKLKEQSEQHAKEQLDTLATLHKLQQTHKNLQSDHSLLIKDCDNKKLQLDEENKKLKVERSEVEKAKEKDITIWKEKYDSLLKEKSRLEGLLAIANSKEAQTNRIKQLESVLLEYTNNCNYKPKQQLPLDLSQQLQINKPLSPPDTTHNVGKSGSLQLPKFDKPKSDKNFREQESVSPGLYHIAITTITNETKKANNTSPSNNINDGDGAAETLQKLQEPLSFSAQNNRSLILNSVENFQILPKPLRQKSEEMEETQIKEQPEMANGGGAAANAVGAENNKVPPLSAPRKLTVSSSTQSAKLEQHVLEADVAQVMQNASSSTSSSTSLPPLPLPPNQRKQLPDMVAPIPKLVDMPELNEVAEAGGDKKKALEKKIAGEGGGENDVDAAIEDTEKKQENDENETNNRYANVVKDMDKKGVEKKSAAADNNDSGAHEVKDQDTGNEVNFNLPVEEDDNNNFFDAGEKNANGDDSPNGNRHKDDLDNEDDSGLVGGGGDVGDIAVKSPQLLDAENLNNEVAGDQGKEFPDGLHSEEGNDEDEDDVYGNVAARHQGGEAIRN